MWTALGFIAAFHGLDSLPVPRMYLVFSLLESFRLSDVVRERYLRGALLERHFCNLKVGGLSPGAGVRSL